MSFVAVDSGDGKLKYIENEEHLSTEADAERALTTNFLYVERDIERALE